MLRFLIALLLPLLLAAVAYGGTVEITKLESRATYGAKISALALTSSRWTGWIDTGIVKAVAFDVTFTDANASCTAVTMVCETSSSAGTADDAGFDLHMTDCASGTCTSYVRTWTYTTAGTKKFTFIADKVHAPWLNCKFSATGTPAAADTVTVLARGLTP